MKKSQALPLKIRHPSNEDIPFLFNSWLKSLRETGFLCQGVSNTIFFENHHKIIQKILKRATVYIACDERFPDQIFGYIVGEKIEGILVVHYVYVKHNFRRTGIAKQLLNMFDHDANGASCCTHLTRHAEKLLPKYNMIYHPYIVLVDYDTPAVEQVEEEQEPDTQQVGEQDPFDEISLSESDDDGFTVG